MTSLQSIKYSRGSLQILDQLLLPNETVFISLHNVYDAHEAITKMQVRGATAIPIVAALALAVDVLNENHNFADQNAVKYFIIEALHFLESFL
jgi:methylthioribose-1-phosphate isomerase